MIFPIIYIYFQLAIFSDTDASYPYRYMIFNKLENLFKGRL